MSTWVLNLGVRWMSIGLDSANLSSVWEEREDEMPNLPKSPIFLIETVCVAGSYTMTLRLFAASAILEGWCSRKPGMWRAVGVAFVNATKNRNGLSLMYVGCSPTLLLMMMMKSDDVTVVVMIPPPVLKPYLYDKLPRFLFTLVAVATRDSLNCHSTFSSSFPLFSPCQSHRILPPSPSPTLPYHCLQLLIALTLYPSCSASLSLFLSLDTYVLSTSLNWNGLDHPWHPTRYVNKKILHLIQPQSFFYSLLSSLCSNPSTHSHP